MIDHRKQGAIHILSAKDVPADKDIHEARKKFSDCIAHGIPQVIFDLSLVPLVSSEALEMLLDFRDQCAKRGGTFKLCGSNSLVADVLRVTGVTETTEFFTDELHAIGSFSQ